MIAALCGGVGGSKLVHGLYHVLPPNTLDVVVNTADDVDLWGLHVCPDLDTVTYTLAEIAQRDLGWGIEGDTFHALSGLQAYGMDIWFRVGDRDLATHIYRSQSLREGQSLTQVTAYISTCLGIHARVLPMTDGTVATQLQAGGRWLAFQEYFVRERHAIPVHEVRYADIDTVRPTEEVVNALRAADVIVLVNSNPVLSILPILAIPGVRDLIASVDAPRVAVSPLIGESSVTGPAAELMRLTGHPATVTGLASLYRGLIDGIVIDRQDMEQTGEIEALGIQVLATDTIMRNGADRDRLASETIAFARGLR